MCFDILLSPLNAISNAKQKKDVNRTIITLLQVAVIFAAAAFSMTAGTTQNIALLAGSLLGAFSFFVIFAVILGWTVHVAAVNLGGKGSYYEGLTAITYSLLPFSVGMLIVALLGYIPAIGRLLGSLAVFPTIAATLSLLYRSVKELYRTDMVVSLVTVSVMLTAVLVGIVFLSSSVVEMMMQ
jgi:hypothetical protein